MEIEQAERVKSSQYLSYEALRSHLNVIRLFSILVITSIIILIGTGKIELKLSITRKLHLYTNSKDFPAQVQPFRPQRQFDVVLSYYKEDVNYVARFIGYLKNALILKNIQSRIIVYNKNFKMNNTYLKDILKADVVQLLDNVGREGGTYLYHMIQNYNAIANHTLFSQAGFEGITNTSLADWFSNRLEKQFNSSVGYMPLVVNDMISIYDCGMHVSGHFQRLVDLWGMLQQTLCPPSGQAVAFRGQFLVSGKRIRSRPLEQYKYVYEIITANSAHWIHRDPRSPNWGSSPENPLFGHIVERLWTVLFNCTNPDLAQRCRRNDCACYD